MDVSGKIRLWTRRKISTLTLPEHDSGDSWKDCNDEGEEESREEDREEDGEEEEEVKRRVHPKGSAGCCVCCSWLV
jgi:hypothetical protein